MYKCAHVHVFCICKNKIVKKFLCSFTFYDGPYTSAVQFWFVLYLIFYLFFIPFFIICLFFFFLFLFVFFLSFWRAPPLWLNVYDYWILYSAWKLMFKKIANNHHGWLDIASRLSNQLLTWQEMKDTNAAATDAALPFVLHSLSLLKLLLLLMPASNDDKYGVDGRELMMPIIIIIILKMMIGYGSHFWRI